MVLCDAFVVWVSKQREMQKALGLVVRCEYLEAGKPLHSKYHIRYEGCSFGSKSIVVEGKYPWGIPWDIYDPNNTLSLV